MDEFADLLSMSISAVEKYCSGARDLPEPQKFLPLEIYYGIDIQSLYGTEVRHISGEILSGEYCRAWKEYKIFSRREAKIAARQVAIMNQGILITLSKIDPLKARSYLFKLNQLLNEVLAESGVQQEVENYFKQTPIRNWTQLKHYQHGMDLRGKKKDLPYGINGWEEMMAEIKFTIPIKVYWALRPAYGLPLMKVEVADPVRSAGYKTTGCWRRYYKIEQLNKTWEFSRAINQSAVSLGSLSE